jgi:hypothetical protein
VYVSYWNLVLFPLMVITRELFRGGPVAVSDVKLYPRMIDTLCRAATDVELALLKTGLRFPFGGSIIAIAVRTGVAHG